jgi:hypothetical protein
MYGGEGGIRTLGVLAHTHDFQSCTFGHSVTSPIQYPTHCKQWFGGEGGIRTRGRLTPTPDFESGTFDLSDTSPTPQLCKERREDISALGASDPTSYPNPVVQAWHMSKLKYRLDRARFRTGRAIHKTVKPRV